MIEWLKEGLGSMGACCRTVATMLLSTLVTPTVGPPAGKLLHLHLKWNRMPTSNMIVGVYIVGRVVELVCQAVYGLVKVVTAVPLTDLL